MVLLLNILFFQVILGTTPQHPSGLLYPCSNSMLFESSSGVIVHILPYTLLPTLWVCMVFPFHCPTLIFDQLIQLLLSVLLVSYVHHCAFLLYVVLHFLFLNVLYKET